MKAKVTICIDCGNERIIVSEKNKEANYNGVIEMINEASIRAEEIMEDRRIQALNEES